jgi:hypothetical protein
MAFLASFYSEKKKSTPIKIKAKGEILTNNNPANPPRRMSLRA